MMRKLLMSCVTLMTLTVAGANAQNLSGELITPSQAAKIKKTSLAETVKEDTMIIGNCTAQLGGIIIYNNVDAKLGCATKVAGTQVAAYAGNRITSIFTQITSKAQNVEVFIRKDLYGKDLAVGKIANEDISDDDWTEITLDTPFLLDGTEFFMGLRMNVKANDKVFYFDGTNTVTDGGWIMEDDIWIDYSNYGWGSACLLGVMVGDNFLKNDVAVSTPFVIGGVVPVDDFFETSFQVYNKGINTISQFDAEVFLDGKFQARRTIYESLAYGGYTTVSFDGLLPSKEGTQELKVRVYNLNGTTEDSDTEDNEATSQVFGYTSNSGYKRNVLLQHFSTQVCPNCPAGHTAIKNALDSYANKDNVIWHTHHSGYQTDGFTNATDNSMTMFFGSEGMFAPGVMMDRTYLTSDGMGLVMYVSEAGIKQRLNQAMAVPAFVVPTIVHQYNEETRELTVKVELEASVSPLPNESDLRLTIYTQESRILGSQAGAAAGYMHDHVNREPITGIWGDSIVIPVGKSSSAEYKYTLPKTYKADNMSIVAFVNNYDTSSLLNWQVYNSTAVEITKNGAGVNDINGNETEFTYANGNIIINNDYTNGFITNLSGAIVKTFNGESTVKISDLGKGIFIVNIDGKSLKVVL